MLITLHLVVLYRSQNRLPTHYLQTGFYNQSGELSKLTRVGRQSKTQL